MSDNITLYHPSIEAMEQRARRAAKRIGLMAIKSRAGVGSSHNRGRFQLIDPNRNAIVAGSDCELTPEDIITFCEGRE
jgi:hypothetical protein